ncbi:MAG: PEP-CTERM sorting domain-containing protein [Deltaproteobacteria bacterium]|nr:PEP-CTERM sorting domain-containing protein [Deltaproteobacteria bacterium]
MKHLTHRIAVMALGLALFVAGPATAAVFTFDDPDGLDDGLACATSESTCDLLTKDFSIGTFGAASGTIAVVGTSASIAITVPSVTFVGSYDGVEEVVFTDVSYSVSGWFTMDFGGTLTGLGSPTGTVSGTYEQFDAGSISVSGPTAFSESVSFSNLLCTNTAPSGVCGFSVGTLRDFQLDVGAVTPASHDFTHTFNLAAPEPGTAVLVGLGLLGLGLRRRRA